MKVSTRLKAYDDHIRRMEGVLRIGGVDEAGRGALAGPVVAAAVVLGPGAEIEGVNDSKLLKPERREELVPRILAVAETAFVGLATPDEIDGINILRATLLASQRALRGLTQAPEFLITDYLKIPAPPCRILPITKADSTSLAVAAASVLAKVARDRLMRLLDEEFAVYGLARHKGYGTEEHLEALRVHGPCCIHRLTFAGVGWFDAARKEPHPLFESPDAFDFGPYLAAGSAPASL